MERIRRFRTEESGQGLTELMTVVALLSLVVIMVLIAFRDELGRIIDAARTELSVLIGSIMRVSGS